MWPFKQQPRFPGVKQNKDGTIEFHLTEAEARAADIALQAFRSLLVHPEIADRLRSGTIAVALSRHAKDEVRTHCLGVSGDELKAKWPVIRATLERAIASEWKAYTLCPLAVFLYHRASFYQMLGMNAEARELFVLFLKTHSEYRPDHIDQALMNYEGTGMEKALSHAEVEAHSVHP